MFTCILISKFYKKMHVKKKNLYRNISEYAYMFLLFLDTWAVKYLQTSCGTNVLWNSVIYIIMSVYCAALLR